MIRYFNFALLLKKIEHHSVDAILSRLLKLALLLTNGHPGVKESCPTVLVNENTWRSSTTHQEFQNGKFAMANETDFIIFMYPT